MMPQAFIKLVQDALNRLYDSPYLNTHPLVKVLLAPQQRALQPSQELRRLVLQTIRAMRPQPGTPAQSPDWRAYRILELRYLEGLTPAQAMDSLVLSRSQFFRDQANIVEALAQLLWEKRPSSVTQQGLSKALGTPLGEEIPADLTRGELAHLEVRRLSEKANWEESDVAQTVTGLRSLLDTLCRQKGSTLQVDLTEPVQNLSADRIMLRQALLTVLTYAIDQMPGGKVVIRSFQTTSDFGLEIDVFTASDASAACLIDRRQGIGLRVSQELMTAMNGTLEVAVDTLTQWRARLTWPCAVTPILLIVDDNEEFANLCRRYLSAYDWQVVGVAEAAGARDFLAVTRPSVILLDIMLPKEDGWELLAWLKSEPKLRDIPVVICSVLYEPDLAQMLDAAAYLTKPLSQSQLIHALRPGLPTDTSPVSIP